MMNFTFRGNIFDERVNFPIDEIKNKNSLFVQAARERRSFLLRAFEMSQI